MVNDSLSIDKEVFWARQFRDDELNIAKQSSSLDVILFFDLVSFKSISMKLCLLTKRTRLY